MERVLCSEAKISVEPVKRLKYLDKKALLRQKHLGREVCLREKRK